MSADTRQSLTTGFGHKRQSFRHWRGQRPFWGGVLTLLAGIPIMYVPYQNLTLGSLTIRMSTTAGAGSLIIGVLLVVLGLTMWFQPQSRVFAGVAAILLALVSLVVSNFGAFLIGFLLGLIGGALGVSWVPGKTVAAEPVAERADRTEQAEEAGHPAEDAGTNAGTGPASDNTAVSGASPADGVDAHDGNGRHRAG
ncbi:DUF6114 domain-containing protein [Streptomyces sp. WMMB303]|uniref:DUF6114 domain-containing protein n=1 Tax=Streptomyces sp. WMMB303 TaxID=3034154 RepID=UPI0023EB17F8|nr:DUF6114 domain-containing protein [Streptomyces sp. WMMB303]MDF4253345.1 DUF6114 domain-containing protein [Streptomyces sp. WMMB303]